MARRVRIFVIFSIVTLPLLTGCGEQDTRWREVQQQTRGKKAVSTAAFEGSAFNKFFPKVERPWDMVADQEKAGTAIWTLKKDGNTMAELQIFDTASNPEARDKYREASEAVKGCPMAAVPGKGTGILVGERFQVVVRSKNDAFDTQARKAWLEKFDLDGLRKLLD
jgi:hypothetical protein